MSDKNKFITQFHKVKKLGWVESNRQGNTGIGKTFEDYMGVVENNSEEPDLFGYEIKSQRKHTASYVTLFTKAPSFPPKANNTLRLNYGTSDATFPKLKSLHVSIFCTKEMKNKGGFTYTLLCDDNQQKIFLIIKNTEENEIVSSDIYWTYFIIEKKLKEKLKNLAMIFAETKTEGGQEFFNFNKCCLYTNASFTKFLDMLKNGKIMFDIRIGSYKDSNKLNYGKTHDHGSGFRVSKKDLINLYSDVEEIL